MRLSVEETLRNLKQVEEKYKIRFTPTGEVNISEMARDCIDTIEALQQENEQLRAHVARMRGALQYYADVKRWGTVKLQYVPTPEVAKKALAAIDKAIGGGDVDKG